MTRRTRRWAILAVAGVLTFTLAGAVVAARFGASGDVETLIAAERSAPLLRVADIGAGNGKPARGVFAQITSSGHFCLWDAVSASSPQRQGGCDPVEDPLGGRLLSASLAYEGGPAAVDVSDARLVGLVAASVAGVQVLMSDGTRREVLLKKASLGGEGFQAFGFRFGRADLRRGVGPTAVIAVDETGEEVDRQPTGFAG
ncbi:MAG TPA: hypothetical protein VJK66_00850 [Gaiellaceae bacterium]|nr:hypothetical protein [Gaiellaceae bacterium]